MLSLPTTIAKLHISFKAAFIAALAGFWPLSKQFDHQFNSAFVMATEHCLNIRNNR